MKTAELQMRLISSLRSVCHEIIFTDPLFRELQEVQYMPIPFTSKLQKIQQERLFIYAAYNPEFPNAMRRFRSPILHKVLAATLYWRMNTVGYVRGVDGKVTVPFHSISRSRITRTFDLLKVTLVTQ